MAPSTNLLREFVRPVVTSKSLSSLRLAGLTVGVILSVAGCSTGKSWMENLTEGRNALASKDYATAEKSFQTAITASEAKFGHDAAQTATCMSELGGMYLEQQEYRKAYKIYKDLVPLYEKIEPDSPDSKRVEEEYKKLKKKLKKYKLEVLDEEPKKSDETKKPDETKSDSSASSGQSASSSDVKKNEAAASSKADGK